MSITVKKDLNIKLTSESVNQESIAATNQIESLITLINRINRLVNFSFLVQRCSRCDEKLYYLKGVSEINSEIDLECSNCSKSMWVNAENNYQNSNLCQCFDQFNEYDSESIYTYAIILRSPEVIKKMPIVNQKEIIGKIRNVSPQISCEMSDNDQIDLFEISVLARKSI